MIGENEYAVVYENNIHVGQATVTVSDKDGGNYIVSGSATFTITPASISSAVVTVAGGSIYDGTEQTPEVTVTLGGKTLVEGTDYTLSYADNVDAGTATVTVTGIGNYTGEVQGSFTIDKAVITDISATMDSVKAPKAQEAVQSEVASGSGYSAVITWEPVDSTYGFNTVYTAVLTLTPDKNHVFGELRSDGWNVEVGEDGIATLTKTFSATRKEKIKALDTIENVILETHTNKDGVIANYLPTTVNADTETGKTVSLTLSWNCESFNTAPNAENTFFWTATCDESYDASGVTLTGSITVTNPNALPVNITGTDQEVTYNGTVDISGMFTIDENAGTPSYSVTNGTGEGTLNGSILTVTKAGTFTVTVRTAANGIYAAGEASATLPVNPKTLTPSISNTEKVYDGTTNAPDGCTIVLDGIVGDDEVTAAAESCAYDSADAGDRTITATGITLSGTASGNYVLSAAEITAAGKITKRAPEITFADQTITYGDTPTAATADSNGVITYTYEANVRTGNGWPVNAGTYTVTATVAETDNYLSGSKSITLTINRKPIQVPEAVTGLIYNGETQTGVENGTGYTLSGNTAKNAGSYNATATLDGNHVWSLADGTSEEPQTIAWSIGKKEVTVTITANGGTYNGNPYPAEAKLDGVVTGDEVLVTLTYTDSEGNISTDAPTNAGSYTVTASIPEGNYTLTGTVSKDFTIAKAGPGLNVPASAEKTYGDADFNLNATQTGNGELTYTSSDETVATVDGNGNVHIIGAGSTVITVTAGESDNYAAESITVTVNVRKAAASLTVEAVPEKTYGDAAFDIVYQRNGESNVVFTSSDPSVVTVDESGKVTIVGAGSAVIKLSMEESGNYLAASTEVSVVVNPKTLTLTIIPNGGVFGQTITGAEAKLEGVVDGDQVDVTLTYTKEGETTGSTTVPKAVGIYTVTATISDPNYTLAEAVTAQFVVRQPITITVKDVSKTYSEQEPELSYEITEGVILDGKPLNIQLQRTAGEDVGTYSITALNVSDSDPIYAITVEEGTLTILPMDISGAQVILGPALTANGQKQTQTVTSVTVVNSQGEILNVTYTVTGNTVVNAGEYTMTITGTGNFTGTKEQAFTVLVEPTEPESTEPTGTTPETGDNRWMGLWGMIMLLSAAAVAELLEKRKKIV